MVGSNPGKFIIGKEAMLKLTEMDKPGSTEYFDWTGSDYDAIIHLKSKGIEEVDGCGFLSPPYWPFEEDPKTSAAINYLCDEWDYCYGERKQV